MYQYIYDSFLSDAKYFKILAIIENRLADLGLQGRVDRLTLFKDPRELIMEGIKKGVRTVVAVGNDATLNQIINSLDGLNLTIGMIPVGHGNEMAKVLGIGEGTSACDCLSNRLVQKIDLGKINDQYFLSHIQILSAEVNLRCGSKYYIKSLRDNRVGIYNLPTFDERADPQDGYLEARIKPRGKGFLTDSARDRLSFFKNFSSRCRESSFPVKKIFLESKKELPVLVDGLKTINTPAEVEILPQKLKIIVGKNRLF